MKIPICFLCLFIGSFAIISFAEEKGEKFVETIKTPFITKQTTTTYVPSKQAFDEFREETLKGMNAGRPDSFQNHKDAPYKIEKQQKTVHIEGLGVGYTKEFPPSQETTSASEEAFQKFGE